MAKLSLHRDMYKEAQAEGISLSQYLENLDPSPEGSKLSAFERQLKEHNIVTQSMAGRGISASKVEAFYRTDESKILFPEYINMTVKESMIATSILPYLIAMTTEIDSNAYKSVRCVDQPKGQRKRRVTEASELPKSKLVTSTSAIQIYKFGTAIEASYEAIRRMKIDMLAIHIRRIAQQAANDEVGEVLNVITVGDGNANPASVHLNRTLDSNATAGILSQDAFINFLLEFYPYSCNTLVCNKAALVQVLKLLYPGQTSSQLVTMLMGGMALPTKVKMPQGFFADVTILYSPDIADVNGHPSITGIDSRYSIEKVVELGSTINEADRFILNQTEVLTVSENSGFSKMFTECTKILEIN